MAFEELAGFIRPGFDLPILGKAYYVPPPCARDGVWLQSIVDAGETMAVAQAVTAADRAILSDEQERTIYQMALGAAYDELLADAVPWPVVKHAGMTALIYWTRGPQLAEQVWASFGQADGDAAGKAPNRAARRAGPRTAKKTPQPA